MPVCLGRAGQISYYLLHPNVMQSSHHFQISLLKQIYGKGDCTDAHSTCWSSPATVSLCGLWSCLLTLPSALATSFMGWTPFLSFLQSTLNRNVMGDGGLRLNLGKHRPQPAWYQIQRLTFLFRQSDWPCLTLGLNLLVIISPAPHTVLHPPPLAITKLPAAHKFIVNFSWRAGELSSTYS